MPYTMEDFIGDYVSSHLKTIPPEERRKAVQSLSPEQLLDSLSSEQRERLKQLLQQQPFPPSTPHKPKRRRRRTDS